MKTQTIFRNASPTGGYTTISNRLLQAKGVSPEVRGFVATLLSYPLDWSFNYTWAEEQFGMGETKLLRIIRDAKKAGFVKVEKERNGQGHYTGQTVYYFTDVPNVFAQTAATETPVTGAASTAKTHGVENPGAGKITPHTKETSSLQRTEEEKPMSEVPSDVRAEPVLFAEVGGANKPKAKKANSYTEAFEGCWAVFPCRNRMSKAAAFKSWQKQDCENEAEAVKAGILAYVAQIKSDGTPDDKVKHMQGWLTDRRWEGYAAIAQETAQAKAVETQEREIAAIAMDISDGFIEDMPTASKYGHRRWLDIPAIKRSLAEQYARMNFGWSGFSQEAYA